MEFEFSNERFSGPRMRVGDAEWRILDTRTSEVEVTEVFAVPVLIKCSCRRVRSREFTHSFTRRQST